MSPRITSWNMDDAYIIDDLPSLGGQHQPAARWGGEQPASKPTGTRSGMDTEAEGTSLPRTLAVRSLPYSLPSLPPCSGILGQKP